LCGIYYNCKEKTLPKLAVEASLCFARITRHHETFGPSDSKDREIAANYHEKAKALLEEAEKLCEKGFKDAKSLLRVLKDSLKLLQKEWYEDITAEECDAIRKAMVSGPQGIASHSVH
jgi:hypothetical protein